MAACSRASASTTRRWQRARNRAHRLARRESLSVRGRDRARGVHRRGGHREHRRRRAGDAARGREEPRTRDRRRRSRGLSRECSRPRGRASRQPTAPRARGQGVQHTARYDAAISGYLRTHSVEPTAWPDPLAALSWRLAQPLRYGENPHQSAALYRTAAALRARSRTRAQLQGKELSFNNLVDADAAFASRERASTRRRA